MNHMKTKYLTAILALIMTINLPAFAKSTEFSEAAIQANRLHTTGGFEIYALPARYNMIVDDEISFPGWVSHIPVQGKIIEAAHRGTDHNLTHDYDTHVPLVFWGPGHVRRGSSEKRVSVADIAPTLAALLNVENIPNAVGKPLSEPFVAGFTQAPKTMVVFLIDQGGWYTLRQHQGYWPNLARLMSEGFTFNQEYVDYGASGTGASHAVLGTGTYPFQNGIFDNKPFMPAIGKRSEVYTADQGVDMMQLKQPTVIDLLGKQAARHAVTLAYSSASRAALGFGGHGASYMNNGKSTVFWFDAKAGKFSADEKLFTLPEASKKGNFDYDRFLATRQGAWSNQTCLYRDGKPFAKCWMASPAFSAFEGETLAEVIKEQRDDLIAGTQNLIFIAFKGVDYCGHYMGQESLECHETIKTVDDQIGMLVDLFKGIMHDDLVVMVTADHGVAPLPDVSGGIQIRDEYLMKVLNEKFCQLENSAGPVKAILNSVIHVDRAQLKNCGHTMDEIVAFLKMYKVNGKLFFNYVKSFADDA